MFRATEGHLLRKLISLTFETMYTRPTRLIANNRTPPVCIVIFQLCVAATQGSIGQFIHIGMADEQQISPES